MRREQRQLSRFARAGHQHSKTGENGPHTPGCFLADEELGFVDSEPDLAVELSDISIIQGRKGSQEERAGSW